MLWLDSNTNKSGHIHAAAMPAHPSPVTHTPEKVSWPGKLKVHESIGRKLHLPPWSWPWPWSSPWSSPTHDFVTKSLRMFEAGAVVMKLISVSPPSSMSLKESQPLLPVDKRQKCDSPCSNAIKGFFSLLLLQLRVGFLSGRPEEGGGDQGFFVRRRRRQGRGGKNTPGTDVNNFLVGSAQRYES